MVYYYQHHLFTSEASSWAFDLFITQAHKTQYKQTFAYNRRTSVYSITN